MNQFMLQGTGDRNGIAQPVTEQVNAPTVSSAGSYPVIGAFNANIPNRIVEQDGYFCGKWFEKIAGFLFKRAD